ncbi:hypothetical protein PPL_08843 [Heterostelium album PN500]|uniref:Uncharacterized protein n=1 Tax=Heterostelium pallidum (strain ATCC 26659 / Pp 5 / PN500) TaxID=670386 RepID=D3BJW3_HETP5|nr:hypothetical protein PPL_08843 [Heterostelium album PN500]EFA78193.1 hypothetical protein PPL_08843 [Heterostelium album PN500]|eukprot:XP_020430319.1 hypothetical protein PPL_08843 [Heterostelium album PN500]
MIDYVLLIGIKTLAECPQIGLFAEKKSQSKYIDNLENVNVECDKCEFFEIQFDYSPLSHTNVVVFATMLCKQDLCCKN